MLAIFVSPSPFVVIVITEAPGDLGGHERHSFSLYVGMDLPLCRTGIPPPSILADRVRWFRPRVSNGLSTSPFPPFSFHHLPIARGRTCGMSGSHSPSPPSPSCTPCRCCVPFCVLRITSRGERTARPLTLVLYTRMKKNSS